MNLSEKISKLSPYFKAFNVTEGVAYALVTFPDKWTTLPSKDYMEETYGVNATEDGNSENGYYFFTDNMDNTDKLFDAIEYTIYLNKSIEEKEELFIEKINELKDIFTNEPLEKLKTLYFYFNDTTSTKTNKISKKPKKDKKIQKKQDKVETPNVVVNKKPEVTESAEIVESIEVADEEVSNLMKLAMEEVGA